ncbi:MAG: MMPL family transporter, partial [Nocardioidaceae bacterium]
MHRQVAGVLTGRRTKWVALVLWIIVVGVAGSLSSKLSSVEKNDAASYLPGDAESTQALDKQADFQDTDTLTTLVIYERTSGITPADVAKAKADVKQFSTIDELDGKVKGPVPSKDHQALQTIVPLNLGSSGWFKAADIIDSMTETAGGQPGLHAYVTGPGGVAADSAKAFKGIDGKLLYSTIGVVIVILLLTYRSPVLWLFPVISAGVALLTAQGVIYLIAKYAGVVVNSQSAGILSVLVFGAGTDYA